jgi:hypothetical protein
LTATAAVLLWLFVIDLGIAAGAALYERAVIVPMWLANPASIKTIDPGRKFWAFVTTVPLTLLTIANLVLAFRAHGPLQSWWLAASLLALLERAMTFGYFIPTALRMMKGETAALPRWIALNYIRLALALVGWLAALETFSIAGGG